MTYTSKPPAVSSPSHCIQIVLYVFSWPAGHCVVNDVLGRVCSCFGLFLLLPTSRCVFLSIPLDRSKRSVYPIKPIISFQTGHLKGRHGDSFFRDSRTERKKSWVLINFTVSTISAGQQTRKWPQRTRVSLTYSGFNECILFSGPWKISKVR